MSMPDSITALPETPEEQEELDRKWYGDEEYEQACSQADDDYQGHDYEI